MSLTRRAASVLAVIGLALCACGASHPVSRPEWIVHAQLAFFAADGRTPQAAPPLSAYRLWFPYVIGDLYGPPGAGELACPQIGPGGTFTLDLNPTVEDLRTELMETRFTLPYLRIEPAQARLARLAPAVLQAEGIDPIGRAEWRDAGTGLPLMLLYVDRPAHLVGRSSAGGRLRSFDVRASEAGYLWVVEQSDDARVSYAAIAPPARVLLAVVDGRSGAS